MVAMYSETDPNNGGPYRSPARSNPYLESEKSKFTMPSIPVFGYVFLATVTFTAFGLGCEYLTRGLAEGHASVSAVGYGIGMASMGIDFLIFAAAKAMK